MSQLRSRAVFQICFVLFLISTAAIAQNTIHVPADQPTIQAAINAAAPGDTVLVAPGTYVENINFIGKAITVTSSDGAGTTIIDGSAAGSVVTFNHNETPDTILSGFTIRNGRADDGAGIYIFAASPNITNNVITHNHGVDGVGIEVRGGSPIIRDNTITDNGQDLGIGQGAAIYILGAASTNVSVIGNLITNNRLGTDSIGGILVAYYGSALIQNNYIAGNSSYNTGGVSVQSHPTATTTIVGNVITNNNSGAGGGAGGFNDQGSGRILFLNNTLYGNTSGFNGGSEIVTSIYQPNSTYKNNIVYATSGTAIACPVSGVFPATNNIVYSPSPATNGNCPAFTESNGNIVAEPGMVNPAGGDFHLHDGSPAIDAGVNDPNLPSADQGGTTRVLDGNNDGSAVADIGAFEFMPGAAPAGWAVLTPFGATFPTTTPGSSAGPINFTLLNSGSAPLTIDSISVNSAFAQTNNCPTILPLKATCLIQVTFTPTANSNFSGMLSVATDGANGTVTASLSGVGNGVFGTITPAILDFGHVIVGTDSNVQTLTLTNTGSAPLVISTFILSGPFSTTAGGCSPGIPIAPGASCGIYVLFHPSAIGPTTGTLALYSNAVSITPTVVNLSGLGDSGTTISVTPTSLSFGTLTVGNSQTQVLTVSNTGGTALTIYAIQTTSSNFFQTNDCGSTVAPGASCSINVTFTPSAVQQYSGTLIISSNANTGHDTHYVSLSGTGGIIAVSIQPSSIDFGQQVVGVMSTPQMVFISNTGSMDVDINTISLVGADFQQTNTCPARLVPLQGCIVNITFTPGALGARNGSLTITHSAPGSPAIISLSGAGLAPPAPMAALSTTSLTFTIQRVGTESPRQVITLSNTGNASLTISSIAIVGANVFLQRNLCPPSLVAGSSCPINVSFRPTQSGTVSANLVITDDSGGVSGSTQSVALTGTGGASSAAVSPASLTFPTTKTGTSTGPAAVTITNSGSMSLNISSISTTEDFSQSNNCASSVAPGASCIVNVVFTPTATGLRTGTLTINSDAQNGAVQTASLSGTGVGEPLASIAPGTLAFATIPVGTQTNGNPITLTNVGNAPMSISSIVATGDFAQDNNCSTMLPIGSSCVIYVWFVPTAAGTRTGLLTITDDAPTSPQTVSLSGSATDFNVTVSPSTVSINPNQNASYNVTVSAVGGAYNQSIPLLCSGLPAGATCTLTPTSLNPGSTSQTAKLKIITSNGGAPQGTYTIVVTGMVGSVVHSGTATLIVK